MSKDRANFLSYLLVVAVVGVAAWLYPTLPDPVPVHWNVADEPDRFVAKPWGVVIMPAIAIVLFFVMRLIPVVSPGSFRSESSAGAFHTLQVALVGLGSFAGILGLLQASGYGLPLGRLAFATLGLLLMVLGNYCGRIRRNSLLGIRTPWTLASDEVWARTHRLAGRLLVPLGAVLFAGAFLAIPPGWLLLMVLLAALALIVYSRYAYRRVETSGEK